MLTCKADFPSEWAKAKPNTNKNLIIPIPKNILPYWMEAAKLNEVKTEIKYFKLGVDSKLSDSFSTNKTEIDGVDSADLGKLDSSLVDIFVVLYLGN
ncbi:MAG: hypothetical protein WBL28_10960 [Methylotenera sp.]